MSQTSVKRWKHYCKNDANIETASHKFAKKWQTSKKMPQSFEKMQQTCKKIKKPV